MRKPVVHYTPNPKQYIPVHPGGSALVWPVDHTNHVPGQRVSNSTWCTTSEVVRVGDNGEFETLNTIYKPVV